MDYYKLKVLNNKRKVLIVLGIFLVISAILSYLLYFKNNEDVIVKSDIEINMDDKIDENDNNLLFVDIKGCVINPGVYSFKYSDNARINDLLEKAGGLTEDADTSLLNLSKKLEDEMTIIIYSHNEINEYISIKEELLQKLDLCEIKLKNNACNIDNNDKNLININEATKEELMSISGIGESKANAIIEYRKEKKFTKIDDIKNVDGIGENLFENIKNYITV